jgi:XTP/dITP diphosphohydrolase
MYNLNKLFIASGNKGKISEISEMLSNLPIDIKSTLDIAIAEPEETGMTFADNAILKAKYYGDKVAMAVIADDSGLEVEALGNRPGVLSARYASDHGGFANAMIELEKEILASSSNNYNARFVCVIALYIPNNDIITYEGVIEGKLFFPAKGEKGFGYDPIFIPNGYDKTFADLDKNIKKNISHRAIAIEKLVKDLNAK